MISLGHFKRISGLNCTEYLIRAIANYYGRDYEMMFIGSWGFELDYNKNIFDDEYISDHATNSWNYLKKYHGIEIIWHRFNRYGDFKRFVRNKLKNNEPVMVRVDLYWVPWVVQDYQREHWRHMVLIVGENMDGWLCYDFFSTEENVLPFDHMANCFCDAYDFKLHTYSKIDIKQCEAEIKQGIENNLIKTDAFNKMNQLAQHILIYAKDGMREHSLTLGGFQTSDLMEKLNRISQRRAQFALMLRYYLKQSTGMEKIAFSAEQISYCASCWKSVWGLLQKAYLMKDPTTIIENVSKKIREISNTEEYICKAFLQGEKTILDDTKDCFSNSIQKVGKTIQIPIDAFANHRSICKTEQKNVSSLEDIFVIEDNTLKERRISIGNITYNLCNQDLLFDNISCMGQRIPINKKARGLSLLSNADFAHQTEKIIICAYNNEMILPLNVTFSQWHTAEFGQRIAWKGSAGVMRQGNIETHPLQICIYQSDFCWDQPCYVQELVLPYCPNIHVYGITFYC